MEKLNDVLGYDLKIYQNDEWFCFSLDSVLLANFPFLKITQVELQHYRYPDLIFFLFYFLF